MQEDKVATTYEGNLQLTTILLESDSNPRESWINLSETSKGDLRISLVMRDTFAQGLFLTVEDLETLVSELQTLAYELEGAKRWASGCHICGKHH